MFEYRLHRFSSGLSWMHDNNISCVINVVFLQVFSTFSVQLVIKTSVLIMGVLKLICYYIHYP